VHVLRGHRRRAAPCLQSHQCVNSGCWCLLLPSTNMNEIHSKRIENIHHLITYATEVAAAVAPWWRGQSSSVWDLVPGVHRPGLPTNERGLIHQFMQKAPTRDPICDSCKDTKDWLYLMQHFGFPTRLLDWTESYLIAAFFACRENHNLDGIVWGLNPWTLNNSQRGTSGVLLDSSVEASRLFNEPFDPSAPSCPIAVALSTTQRNQRMMNQQARFTIHGTGMALNRLPAAHKFLTALVIPSSVKLHIVNALGGMGIRLSSLFPDLEHLAKDILCQAYTSDCVTDMSKSAAANTKSESPDGSHGK
jgi:hypothetical protein